MFNYADNRSQRVPLELLSDEKIAVMLDGYQGYQKACDEYDIIRLGCSIRARGVILPPASMQSWAHARRKFKEAQDVQIKASTPAHAPYLRPVGKSFRSCSRPLPTSCRQG